MKRMGWDGGPNGTEWNVGGASEKDKQDKEMFVTTQNELKKVLFPGDGQVGIYFELADPKVYLTSIISAIVKLREREGQRVDLLRSLRGHL